MESNIKSRWAAVLNAPVPAGDGPEERRCAEVRNWPFVQVSLFTDKQDKVAGRRLTDITAESVLWKARQCRMQNV